MKIRLLFLSLLSIFLTSCGTQRSLQGSQQNSGEAPKVAYAEIPEFHAIEEESFEELEEETFSVIDHALQFLGTRYKYGGNSQEGMDCSGLVYTSFLQNEIELPRSSRDMAQLGEQLDLSNVRIGDLLFFITDRRKKNINHVGLVVELTAESIKFIHSSTSKGVIISALNERYWQEHFVMARRIL